MGVERMAGSNPEFGMAEPTEWITHDHADMKQSELRFYASPLAAGQAGQPILRNLGARLPQKTPRTYSTRFTPYFPISLPSSPNTVIVLALPNGPKTTKKEWRFCARMTLQFARKISSAARFFLSQRRPYSRGRSRCGFVAAARPAARRS